MSEILEGTRLGRVLKKRSTKISQPDVLNSDPLAGSRLGRVMKARDERRAKAEQTDAQVVDPALMTGRRRNEGNAHGGGRVEQRAEGMVQPKAQEEDGFFDQIGEAWQRGKRGFEIDLEAYEAATGAKPWEEIAKLRDEYEKGITDLPMRENLMGRALLGATETLPGMIKGYGAGLDEALGAAGAALLAGQAGPQIATPEEVVTLPAAFGAGLAAGSSLEFFKQGTGQFYSTMRNEGVDHGTASVVSQLAGAPYALIEISQVGKLIPGVKGALTSAVKGTTKQVAAQLAKKYGANWAENVTEEIVQEAIGIAGEEIAKQAENYAKDKNLNPKTIKDVVSRLWNTGVDAALSFGLLQLPSATVEAAASLPGETKGKPSLKPGKGVEIPNLVEPDLPKSDKTKTVKPGIEVEKEGLESVTEPETDETMQAFERISKKPTPDKSDFISNEIIHQVEGAKTVAEVEGIRERLKAGIANEDIDVKRASQLNSIISSKQQELTAAENKRKAQSAEGMAQGVKIQAAASELPTLPTEPPHILEKKEAASRDDISAAAAEVEPAPSEAQKEAENYKKGHIKLHGLDVTIENAKGQTRTGKDRSGKGWSVVMPAHYGYIKRTEGADGEHIDVYIGDNPESKDVYVIDQVNADTGQFDEHKSVLAAGSQVEAENIYKKAFSDGKGAARLGGITRMNVDQYKNWIESGDKSNPLASKTNKQQLIIKGGEKDAEKTKTEAKAKTAEKTKAVLDLTNPFTEKHLTNRVDGDLGSIAQVKERIDVGFRPTSIYVSKKAAVVEYTDGRATAFKFKTGAAAKNAAELLKGAIRRYTTEERKAGKQPPRTQKSHPTLPEKSGQALGKEGVEERSGKIQIRKQPLSKVEYEAKVDAMEAQGVLKKGESSIVKAVTDAVARKWGEWNGRNAEDFYPTAFRDVQVADLSDVSVHFDSFRFKDEAKFKQMVESGLIQVGGQTIRLNTGEAVVRIFDGGLQNRKEKGKLDVVLHELGHVLRPYLPEADMKVLTEWAHGGAHEGAWTRGAEEKFARSWERYLLEGKAPNEQLREIFEKLKELLADIYNNVFKMSNPNKLNLDPEVKKVLDGIFAEQIQVKKPGTKSEESRKEKLIAKAHGHPDNESTQAARRILKNQFNIDWQKTKPIEQSVKNTEDKTGEVKLSDDFPVKASKDDIDFERARRAYAGTSFSPEKRARGQQDAYLSTLQETYDALKGNAETEQQQRFLKDKMEWFRRNLVRKTNAMLDASSRTMSTMIAGPANFPTEQNRKRMATYDKRMQELLSFPDEFIKRTRKGLKALRSESQVVSEDWNRLQKSLIGSIATVKGIDSGEIRGTARPLIVANAVGKIERQLENGNIEVARQAMDFIAEQNKKLDKPFITTRHGLWAKVASAEKKVPETGSDTVAKYAGAEVVDNKGAEKVQILFDEKPGEDLRNELKKSGWRWSPKNSAWQRKNTAAGMASAKKILNKHFDVTELQDIELSEVPWLNIKRSLKNYLPEKEDLSKVLKQLDFLGIKLTPDEIKKIPTYYGKVRRDQLIEHLDYNARKHSDRKEGLYRIFYRGTSEHEKSDDYFGRTHVELVWGKGEAQERVEILRRQGYSTKLEDTGLLDLEYETAPPFYSKLRKTIVDKMPNRADANTVRGVIKNVKKEEIEWTGLDDYLNEHPKVSKEEVLTFLDENQVRLEETVRSDRLTKQEMELSLAEEELFDALENIGYNDDNIINNFIDDAAIDKHEKEVVDAYPELKPFIDELQRAYKNKGEVTKPTNFGDLQIPGGENYKEVLLKLPVAKNKETFVNKFHFDEPNILAHVRHNDRTVKGGKMLFIEEIQSDWHQAGRKKGYKTNRDEYIVQFIDTRAQATNETFKTKEDAQKLIDRLNKEHQKLVEIKQVSSKGVPNAPFKNTWHELAFRRLVREAAEKGYDRIGWTTGEQQIDRYEDELRQNVDEIVYEEVDEPGEYSIEAVKGGRTTFDKVLNKNELEELLGKEIAAKIIDNKGEPMKDAPLRPDARVLRGKDLAIGGDGMKGFYDKILVNYARKFGKKFGAMPEKVNINTGRLRSDEYFIKHGVSGIEFPGGEKVVVHSLPVTDKMRETALVEGFELFDLEYSGEKGRPEQKPRDSHTPEQKALRPSQEGIKEDEATPPPVGKADWKYAGRRGFDLTEENVQKKLNNWRVKVTEVLQNSQVRVQQMQKLKDAKLKGKGLDPNESEIRFHGRVGARLEAAKEIMEKITDHEAMFEKDFKKKYPEHAKRNFIADVNKLAISRHAPYVNKHLDEKRAAGMSTEEARSNIRRLKRLPYYDDLKAMADWMLELNSETLKVLLAAEVISEKLYDTLKIRYPYHVPLNRILPDMEDSAIEQWLTGGAGINVLGAGIHRIMGSELAIDDILTNIGANVQEAIVRAEKNRVALSVLQFARENKALGLFAELRKGKELKPTAFDREGNPIWDTASLLRDKNTMGVREKGEQKFLYISDPALAEAVKLGNKEQLDTLTKIVGYGTKFVTATATRFNPAFPPVNLFLDTQEMVAYLMAQKGFGIRGAQGTTKYLPMAMNGIRNAVWGDGKSEWAKLYKQMKADGGTTGGLALSTREQVKVDVEKLRKAARSHPRKAVSKVVKFFDNYNSIFEDATRLSVYQSALARGMTREEAAVLAKEATINFNRKGTLGGHLNAWYAFMNASLQGSTKMIKALKNPKVAAAVGSSIAAATLFETLWNDWMCPDWRDKIPSWDRDKNLVILTGQCEKGKPLSRILVPVSWGLKPIKVIANHGWDIAFKKDVGTSAQATARIMASAVDAYNPVGGSTLLQAATPTVADVPFEVLTNTAWYDKPIYPDWGYYKKASNYKKYFRTLRDDPTGLALINATEYLNNEGGISFSPQSMKYMIEQYGGGTTRTMLRAYKTLSDLIGEGKITDVSQIPVINRFYRSTPAEVVEQWQEKAKMADADFKLAEQATADEGLDRQIKVKDAFDQYIDAGPQEQMQILYDLVNQDPKAYQSFKRRIRDYERGIGYYESQLKDIAPEQRARLIAKELTRAKDRDKRYRELVEARVINGEVAFYLRQFEND